MAREPRWFLWDGSLASAAGNFSEICVENRESLPCTNTNVNRNHYIYIYNPSFVIKSSVIACLYIIYALLKEFLYKQ